MECKRETENSRKTKESGCLRLAVETDVDILFDWANEPLVRKNSFSSKTICYEEHKKWFEKLLENKNCRQYIYMYEGKEIGQARVTMNGEEAEIGYSICAKMRGQGHGSRLLQLVCRQVQQDFPKVQKIVGRVKIDNLASQKAFTKAGFEETYTAFELQISVNQKQGELEVQG